MPRKQAKKQPEPLPRIVYVLGVALLALVVVQAPSLFKRAGHAVQEAVPTILSSAPGTAAEVTEIGPDTVYIPSLNITAPLVYTDAKSEVAFQRALQNGVVHYPGTADLGENGNAYFFGHSSDLPWAKGNYKTVFALLPDIQIGSTLILTDKNNHPYWYRVFETEIVDPDDTHVLSQDDYGKAVVSLQTSYPVGTALQRFIVRGYLLEGPSPITPTGRTPESTP